jgi:DNA polymerase alpha subunit B
LWSQRITLVPNPATFSIGGVVFGATSVDTLMEMSSDYAERHVPKPRPERLPRLAQHLLEQRSFYPLFPAGKATPLDVTAYGQIQLPVSPDVLILPSKLNPFVKEVNGTLVVGPGALCKAKAAGYFAKMEIAPMPAEMIAEAAAPANTAAAASSSAPASAAVLPHRVAERARVSVVRI